MRKTIFITGSSGLIGGFVYTQLAKQHDCFGVDVVASATCDAVMDLTDEAALRRELDKAKPDVIISTAAVKDMLACEARRRTAWAVNVELVANLARYTAGSQATLLHLSSDMIFDGAKGDYQETDSPAPLNWYGATKLAAEQVLRFSSAIERVSMLRTAQVFGPSSTRTKTMLKENLASGKLTNQSILPFYIYEQLKRGQSVALPQDIISSPTPVTLIADVIEQMIVKGIQEEILHVAGHKSYSRLELGRQIALAMNLPVELLEAGEDATSSLRPPDASVNVDKLASTLGIDLRKYDVIEYLKEQISEDQISTATA